MIVGFNTDIRHRGVVYHCQTEDKGKDNPLVETLLYTKGQILDCLQTKYDDVIAEGYDEKKVLAHMEAQHRRGIELIKSDKFLTDEQRAVAAKEAAAKERAIGAASADERYLDDLVIDWINNEMEHEQVELIDVLTDSELVSGTPVELRLKASKNISRGLVSGAKIVIRLISTVAEPQVIFEGQTDRMGQCVARFELPAVRGGNAAIIVRADSEYGSYELRQLVKKEA